MGKSGKSSFRFLAPIVFSLAFLFVFSVFTLSIFASNQTNPHPRSIHVTVVKVSDGDTVQGETPEGTKLKIRLYGIDAPEVAHGKIPGQPMGKESLIVLKNKVLNKNVKIDLLDVDRHRRIVALLWMGSRNINLEMVKEGYAEAYREYLKDPHRLSFMEAEREARTAKKGIWALATYERPSAFKKRNHSRS
jgi:endonuclease YncB( thermonuclease family)